MRIKDLNKNMDYAPSVKDNDGAKSDKNASAPPNKFIRQSNDPKFRQRLPHKETSMLRKPRKVDRSSYDEKTLPQMLSAKDKGAHLAEMNTYNRLREDNQIYMPYESALGLAPPANGSGVSSLAELRPVRIGGQSDLHRSRDISNGSYVVKAPDRGGYSKLS